MRDIRLGDDIDDFCVRCKRITNHVVVSVVKAAPAKVRCRSCHSDHDFRNEQAPPPKIDLRKQALFNEVLKKAVPTAGIDAGALAGEVLDVDEVEADEVEADESDAEEPGAEEIAVEAVAGVEEEAPEPAPKGKAKTAAKSKTKARK
jgi:hypothetical protein